MIMVFREREELGHTLAYPSLGYVARNAKENRAAIMQLLALNSFVQHG
jgi:hypothetical protein